MLVFIAVIFICFICYLIISADGKSMKALAVFLSLSAFVCAFYGIKFLLYVRNKIMPLHKTAGYIIDMFFLLSALAVIFVLIYNFIFTLEGFNLIICSVAAAFFNAVIRSRV